jgi:hypothetical protein
MRYRIFVYILISSGGASCSEDEFKNCTLEEAAVQYLDQTGKMKYNFSYDDKGNGIEVQEFRFSELENDYVLHLTKQYTLSNDLVTSVLSRLQDDNEGTFFIRTYEYEKKGDTTVRRIHNQFFTDGILTDEGFFDDQFFESPKNGVYLRKDLLGTLSLEEYLDGNLIRVALQSDIGTVQAYDTTWTHVTEFIYDNKSNVASDAAIKDLISWVPNNGFCKNNVIKIRHLIPNGDAILINQEFTFSGNTLKQYLYGGTGHTISFNYSCE